MWTSPLLAYLTALAMAAPARSLRGPLRAPQGRALALVGENDAAVGDALDEQLVVDGLPLDVLPPVDEDEAVPGVGRPAQHLERELRAQCPELAGGRGGSRWRGGARRGRARCRCGGRCRGRS